jgi:hypothetical protein
MRKFIIITLAYLLIITSIFAQSPEKMSYQAVIRDAKDNLITGTLIGMEISILQNAVDGTVVYVERQFPTTNDNGLVSIEIGAGAVRSGDFTSIDWANGLFFIKTAIDLNGGSSYSIIGTSQLLSVPYALHAKMAENIVGDIAEKDPVYSVSQAKNITATDITNLSNLSGVNTGDQDLNGLVTNNALGDSIALLRTNIPDKLIIGQAYQGGIIFWLDETGQHGLIVASEDQGSSVPWKEGAGSITNAVRDGIGAGMYNTERIITNQGVGDYAAQLCANYQGGGYGDWYLPSKYELNLLYAQKVAVGIIGDVYWSSTEFNGVDAWHQFFGDGSQSPNFYKFSTYKVRAIRAF